LNELGAPEIGNDGTGSIMEGGKPGTVRLIMWTCPDVVKVSENMVMKEEAGGHTHGFNINIQDIPEIQLGRFTPFLL